jgi:TetR/AcrR family transcriptional repressor of nem operon
VGASVRDISDAAGVTLGSFTNHFTSKEVFALEVLNIYFARSSEVIQDTLLSDDEWSGCLIVNLSIEASDRSEVLRKRLEEISKEIEKSVAIALRAVVKAGEMPKSADCNSLAGFIVFTQHGADMQSRVDKTPRRSTD